jgi:hypothetical protein
MLNNLPPDLFNIIFNFLEFSNKKIELKEIKENINNFNSISLINNLYKEYLYSNKLNLLDLKDITYLIKKYNVFMDDYEYELKYDLEYNKTIKHPNTYKKNGFPILIDIVSSGINNLPLIRRSISSFDNTTLNDIILCLKYFPNSVNSNYGRLRCRHLITPFYFACLNQYIPIPIILLLVENGCIIDDTLLLNGSKIKILEDLDEPSLLNKTRYDEIIKALF